MAQKTKEDDQLELPELSYFCSDRGCRDDSGLFCVRNGRCLSVPYALVRVV